MGLDFGGKALFQSSPLQQETGVLSDRWGQEGSDIKNLQQTFADATVYTVTAGKRLFIKGIFCNAITGNGVSLLDGGSGGTIKLIFNAQNNSTYSIPFDTPLYFDTDVYLDMSGAIGSGGSLTMTGWEEDAP